jgi:hypothetical protein
VPITHREPEARVPTDNTNLEFFPMAVRSQNIIDLNREMYKLAQAGYGITVEEIKKMFPLRVPFSLIWELRRHGGETIVVRSGRRVVGWILKSPIPESGGRSDYPTEQVYIEYSDGMFRKQPKLPKMKSFKKPFNPSLRPMTKAAAKIFNAA